jgi:hypothetical protein
LAQARAVFIDGAVFTEERPPSVGSAVRLVLVAAMLFALVGTIFFVWHAKHLRPPSFVASSAVSGQAVPITVGRWLSAPVMEDVVLSFSDGARFTLRAGSRARLTALSIGGGRLTIERGEMQGAVPARGNSWIIQAGPLDLELAGGTVLVNWDPSVDRASLEVSEGRAVVSGACVHGEARTYAQGARPSFDCLDASL